MSLLHRQHLRAGLVVTAVEALVGNDFASLAKYSRLTHRVRFTAAITDEESADAVLSWSPGHPYLTAELGRASKAKEAGVTYAATKARDAAVRERDAAVAERDELRKLNENLRQLIVLKNQLTHTSMAFPSERGRFSGLEVD